MTNKKFIVYWFDYRHKSTVYPIYEELKNRGLDIECLEFRDYQLQENPSLCEKFYNADYIITSSNCRLPYIAKKAESIVWIWHGAGNVITTEGMGFSNCPVYKKHKLNLLMGQIDYSYFVNNMSNIELVGYTKFDKIPERKVFDNDKKTILFAGEIFNKDRDEKINTDLCEKIAQVAKLYNCNFMVKPYNVTGGYMPYKEDLATVIKEEIDIVPYIKISDIVISDFLGSPIYEAIGLDKQVLFFKHPARINDLFYTDINNCNFGFEITLENVENLIAETLHNPYLFQKERIELKNKLFYKIDGKSTQRAADAIIRECV